jgi:hypothetical protein|tara:strand:+ start:867 stop:1187 length:321 start_codon:yes stop_codon:yes gene_type:complete
MAFNIKQNDTSPSLQATLKDAQLVPVILTSATVKLHMKSLDGVIKVNETMTITDGNGGVVQYDWQAGDTDTVGSYYVEFQVTFADASVETFPNDGNLAVSIVKELG